MLKNLIKPQIIMYLKSLILETLNKNRGKKLLHIQPFYYKVVPIGVAILFGQKIGRIWAQNRGAMGTKGNNCSSYL